MTTLRIGTRGSALALWQARWLAGMVNARHPRISVELVVIKVESDRQPDVPLPEIGSRGVFTGDIEHALRIRRVDVAVHSLKDLASRDPEDLVITVMSPREDPRDVLITRDARPLDDLPLGAVVGTSSLRRRALIKEHRPDLQVAPLRGNVDTRLRKLSEGTYDAIVLAAAGVARLGLVPNMQPLDPLVWVPPAGQGIIAAQARRDDAGTLELLRGMDDRPSSIAARAERAFLADLGVGCAVPVGAYCAPHAHTGGLRLTTFVGAPGGGVVLRQAVDGSATDPEAMGADAARRMRLLGAAELLDGLALEMPLLSAGEEV